ncbi:MAG TPA: SprT-like domain-containing protein [Caulobacteraceae bacterium]
MKQNTPKATSEARHAWLEAATVHCADLLAQAAHPVPNKVRVSIGFAFGTRRAIGQCWPAQRSSDGHFEIVVSPVLSDSVEILATLIHELCHAAVGVEHGHKAPFRKAALAVGLEGKMTATQAGPELAATFKRYAERVGAYPAGKVNPDEGRKKQTTRLVKVECGECGYVARVTRKWLDEAGAPHCPNHGAMKAETQDEGDDDQ